MEVRNLDVIENFERQNFEMKCPKERAIALVPTLQHFDEWDEVAAMLPVGFRNERDVFLGISLQPAIPQGVGQDVAPTLAVKAQHNIHDEVIEADGYSLAIPTYVRGASVGLEQCAFREVEQPRWPTIFPV